MGRVGMSYHLYLILPREEKKSIPIPGKCRRLQDMSFWLAALPSRVSQPSAKESTSEFPYSSIENIKVAAPIASFRSEQPLNCFLNVGAKGAKSTTEARRYVKVEAKDKQSGEED
ncbi:hypothetical protein Salat_1877900 [Sesamum alatum]|uniref:Uncharacterized protein n=1 Tax=Sesamum alatum TaxID=300844 RepID=A0AAE1Y4H8_9LAMI|nr:hypothetical protein Salat_1877900 [Sesamum alatum]